MTERIKKILNKEYQISLVNLLSVTISLVAIGCIIAMVNPTWGLIAIGLFVLLIFIKLEPYLEEALRG